MLFITNRHILGARRSQAGRTIQFADNNPEPGVSLYFCQRQGPERYIELTAAPFFGRLRRSPRQQVLFFLHGFNCQPERRVFPAALRLQALVDELAPGLLEVVPVVWPCDDDFGVVLDYWDDQRNADVSGLVVARMLGKFLTWRDRLGREECCLKHVNVLAHSMGNRVLSTALAAWANDYGTVPALFRNIFMAAPDLANDVFAPGRPGNAIADAARNVVVYYAADDLALRSSKAANVRHKLVRRRLGHTGPADLATTPRNVVAIDCDDFNGCYDRLGHSYLLADMQGRPGQLLRHLVQTVQLGRVAGLEPEQRRMILTADPTLPLVMPANNNQAIAPSDGNRVADSARSGHATSGEDVPADDPPKDCSQGPA